MKKWSWLLLSLLLSLPLIIGGCDFGKEEEDDRVGDYVILQAMLTKGTITFKVEGERKSYNSGEGFLGSSDSFWGADFGPDDEGVVLLLRGDVASGETYDSDEDFAFFLFLLDSNGNSIIYQNPTSSFSLTVTEWDGIGGRTSGTFSGTLDLYSGFGPTTVEITDGSFEGDILEGDVPLP